MARLKSILQEKRWIIKATIVSQISAWCDFGISFLAFALFNYSGGISAAMGAISGGIVNCIMNYKWTFKSSDSPPMCVGIKYFIIWTCSILLNSYGTEILTDLLLASEYLDELNIADNIRFTVSRLFISLIVSVFWNLYMQRRFVFRKVKFDDQIINLYIRLTRIS